MRVSWVGCRGMTLVELLIALGLGASLSAVIMQLFTGSMHLQSVQRAEQDLQQRSAYAQFILRESIRESASSCETDEAAQVAGHGYQVEILAAGMGVVNALPDTQVLRLHSGDCEEPVHFLYIGRRSSDEGQPTGLYRRRQRSDGTYRASEELIEGVSAMTATVGVRLPPTAPGPAAEVGVAYVSIDHVADWTQVFSVTLTLSVEPVSTAGEMTEKGLTMIFSTALRQFELHGSAPGSL